MSHSQFNQTFGTNSQHNNTNAPRRSARLSSTVNTSQVWKAAVALWKQFMPPQWKVNQKCIAWKQGKNFMECDAQVICTDGEVVTREYDGGNSMHAEMSALAEVYGKHKQMYVKEILISSPPCKQCAFVLHLLGLTGKVRTTSLTTVKVATGGWMWPLELQDATKFDKGVWNRIEENIRSQCPNAAGAQIIAAIVNATQVNPDVS